LGDWRRACPEAEVYVAAGLEKKRSDLAITGVLADQPEAGWKDAIDQLAFGGMPMSNEVVFFHRASATLLLVDLAFNVGDGAAPLTKLFFRLNGAFGRVAPTLLERMLIRDREVGRASLERILEWPFERVIVAHRKKKQRFREVREVSVLSTTPEGGSGPAAGGRDSNPRPSGSKNHEGARSDADLQLCACRGLQSPALGCT
jgi:hypothetical protein